MAAGPSDISVILSQAGRIEKITQNSLVQSEVARQILTEQEARARMQRAREVVEPNKAHEITISEQARQKNRRRPKDEQAAGGEDEESVHGGAGEETPAKGAHLIDVVV
ncbi:MAG TPA: hypothetical protein PLW83_04725 [Deltaproteobacteria bacterium]|nr:hypothetical protein [Deltaproteobacteria bacterium]